MALSDSVVVPQAVRQQARKGLALRREHGRGGLSLREASKMGIGSGVARARDLAGGSVTLATLKRMRSYFARHENDKNAKGSESRGYWGSESNPSAGYVAWLLWGGTAGKRWANSILKKEGLI